MKIGSNRMNILPKTLKKRSDYAASWTRSEAKSTPVTSGYAAMQQFDRVTIVPNEDWIVTETGSESPKVSGKGYETYSQIINPGVTTSKVWHATKDRTVHVIEGYGKLWTKNTVAVDQEVILVPGTFVELKAGTAYRFVVEESCLSLLVVQSTKYNSKLETLELYKAKSICLPLSPVVVIKLLTKSLSELLSPPAKYS